MQQELIRPAALGMIQGHRATRSALTDGLRPDAVFALTDSAALGALRALQEHRIRIAEEVQGIGFDDIAEGRLTTPALITVDPRNTEMAEAICSLLLERLQGADRPARVVMPTARLLHREFTLAPAQPAQGGEDRPRPEWVGRAQGE